MIVGIPPAAAQSTEVPVEASDLVPEEGPGQPAGPDTANPSADGLLTALDTSYNEYLALVAGVFAMPGEIQFNYQPLRDSFAALAAEAIAPDSAVGPGAAELLSCLQSISENGVLTGYLARVPVRQSHPTFLQEYIRTLCAAPLGNPYSQGKVPLAEAKLGRTSGDLVVLKKRFWLTYDKGFRGDMNGRVDEGEWFGLKMTLVNKSRKNPQLSSSARLVLLDARSNPCPGPAESGRPGAVPLPEECRGAAILTDQLTLPELSPGEQVTSEAFEIALHPGLTGERTLRLALLVEASGKSASRSDFALKVATPPEMEVSNVTVDDDQTGASKGNNNRRIEPGESIELRTEAEMSGRKYLSKVGFRARQYSDFLSLADRTVGVAQMRGGKAAQIAGDFEFSVPLVEEMAATSPEELDWRFFMDRRSVLWLAVSGCDGRLKLKRDWASNVPSQIDCPHSAPGYRFVVPVDIRIEFGQVFLITSKPPGATVRINDVLVGRTEETHPLLFTRIHPVRNSIVYYKLTVEKPGYRQVTQEIPVIHKDREAPNLTTVLDLELTDVTAALPPEPRKPPPEPVGPTLATRIGNEDLLPPPDVRVKKEPKPEPPPVVDKDEGDKGRFLIFAGGALRFFSPPFKNELASNDWVEKPGPHAGFELGGGYFFADSCYLAANGQMSFSTQDNAVVFYGDKMGPNYVPQAWVESFTTWSLALEPHFRVRLWRILVDAGVGAVVGGVAGEARQSAQAGSDETVPASNQVEELSVSARISAGLSFETNTLLLPYLSTFVLLPPGAELDWGLTAGLGFRL